MAATPAPLKVGAQGTIGSLVLQEIEYFKRLDLGKQEVSSQKQKKPTMDVVSSSGSTRNKSGSGGKAPKKKKMMMKKKVVSIGGFLPSICSAVDVANPGQTQRIKDLGYKNLRTDATKLPKD